MDTILSFGAGTQTTALAIMVAERKLEVDAVVFADTGCEKPETYYYIETYIEPLLKSVSVPFVRVKTERPSDKGNIYDYYWGIQDIPTILFRRCTDHFKRRPIKKCVGKNTIQLIGFSSDEINRAEKALDKTLRFPLIEHHMFSNDSIELIINYGFPVPLKSACWMCIFQPVVEWNWLKNHHPDLFQKALDLEARYHERKPNMKKQYGLLSGTPLWRLKEGLQPEMMIPGIKSCDSGYCSH